MKFPSGKIHHQLAFKLMLPSVLIVTSIYSASTAPRRDSKRPDERRHPNRGFERRTQPVQLL